MISSPGDSPGVKLDYKTASGWVLDSRRDRRGSAPREVDPAVGLPPYVLAGDDRTRLLIEHRDPRLGHLAGAEVLDEGEREARVGDVVDDQELRLGQVDQVRDGREDHRDLEPLVDACVELDVHRVRVLDVERVGEGAGEEEAAAGDPEHQIRDPAVVADRLGEPARAGAELLPGHRLALDLHAGDPRDRIGWQRSDSPPRARRARSSGGARTSRRRGPARRRTYARTRPRRL